MRFFVGQILSEYIGHHDSVQFDIDDGGSSLIIALNHPQNDELEAFYSQFTEVRLTIVSNAIWFTFKFGNLGWMEAPYSPHLSTHLSDMNKLSSLCCEIRIMLIDTETGRILYLGKLIVSNDFVMQMAESIRYVYDMPFNRKTYFALLSQVQNTMTTEQIAQISKLRYSTLD